jgi:hypothetical protein
MLGMLVASGYRHIGSHSHNLQLSRLVERWGKGFGISYRCEIAPLHVPSHPPHQSLEAMTTAKFRNRGRRENNSWPNIRVGKMGISVYNASFMKAEHTSFGVKGASDRDKVYGQSEVISLVSTNVSRYFVFFKHHGNFVDGGQMCGACSGNPLEEAFEMGYATRHDESIVQFDKAQS